MPVNNTAIDLQNFLFGELERLDNPEMTKEELDAEIKRAKAMTDVAARIIDNANLALEAEKLAAEYGMTKKEKPLAGYLGNSNA